MSSAIHFPVRSARHERLRQLALALSAILSVAVLAAILVWLMAPGSVAPAPRNPFGMGLREAAPSATGIGRLILSYQASFNRALEAALSAIRREGGSAWPLVSLGFAYGVFHAAGPGHGKGIISAYLLANERALVRGLAVGLAAALLQGAVAIAIVTVAAILFRATAPTVTRVSDYVETASFAVVALLGCHLAWGKAGRLLGILAARGPRRFSPLDASDCTAGTCGHTHMPEPVTLSTYRVWELAAVTVAAGIRPCAGAMLILVFALSQGLFAAGIAAVVAMSLGTAATTGAIASLAVFAKRTALRFAGGRSGGWAEIAAASIELLIAAFVAVLGASLLAGLSAGIAAG